MTDTIRHDGDTTRRVSLTPTEAAARLGITPDAVRARLRRGTLAGEQSGSEWRVFLPEIKIDNVQLDPPDQRDTDTTRRAMRHDADTTSTVELIAAKDETIETQSREIEFLREQLDRKDRDQAADNALIAALSAQVEDLQRRLDHQSVLLQSVISKLPNPETPPIALEAHTSALASPGREEVPAMGQDTVHEPSMVSQAWRRLRRRT